MGTRAGDCNGGGIAGDLSGWGPFGEDFRLFDSDGRKIVLGRWAVGAEVERPLGICCCEMNGAFPTRSHASFTHQPFVSFRSGISRCFPPFPFCGFWSRGHATRAKGRRCCPVSAAPPAGPRRRGRAGRSLAVLLPFSCRARVAPHHRRLRCGRPLLLWQRGPAAGRIRPGRGVASPAARLPFLHRDRPTLAGRAKGAPLADATRWHRPFVRAGGAPAAWRRRRRAAAHVRRRRPGARRARGRWVRGAARRGGSKG
jgi:hypothetical protein